MNNVAEAFVFVKGKIVIDARTCNGIVRSHWIYFTLEICPAQAVAGFPGNRILRLAFKNWNSKQDKQAPYMFA